LGVAGVIDSGNGYEDDRAFAAGIGFTDIVKRPTPSGKDIAATEYQHGKRLLTAKIEQHRPN
jgi:double-stranded uracil-DNA glycosylase